MESGILGFGIWNTAQGIGIPTDNRNPESKFHLQILESPDSEHSIFWFVFSLLQFGLPCLSKASGRARESKASFKLKLGESETTNKQTKQVVKQKHTRVMGWWKWKEERDQ